MNASDLTNQILAYISPLKLCVLNRDLYNGDYDGKDFKLDHFVGKLRTAKKTPRKQGYFVTLWKKDEKGKNIPLSEDDLCDLLIIHVHDDKKMGQFVFSKNVLIENGIVSSTLHQGKMGFRVYTPWDLNLNKTALKTASWQIPLFIDYSKIDKQQIKMLYQING